MSFITRNLFIDVTALDATLWYSNMVIQKVVNTAMEPMSFLRRMV